MANASGIWAGDLEVDMVSTSRKVNERSCMVLAFAGNQYRWVTSLLGDLRLCHVEMVYQLFF